MADLSLLETWAIPFVSAVAGGAAAFVSAIYWFGRNSVTVNDLHQLRDLAISHRDEIKNLIDSERREVGEGLAALRQKINDVELEAARVYVRRDSWHQAMNQLQDNIGKTDAADQQWRLRIEEKIDRLSERLFGPQQRGR